MKVHAYHREEHPGRAMAALAFGLFAGALGSSSACTAPPVELSAPPWEERGAETLILVLIDGERGPWVTAGDPRGRDLDFRYALVSDDSELSLFALGYRCGSLDRLGLGIAGDRLVRVAEPGLGARTPDLVWSSSYRGGSQSPWVEADALPEDLPAKLGVSFQAPTRCPSFEDEELGLRIGSEHPGVTLVLDETTALVGSSTAGLWLMHRDGRAEPFEVTAPSGERPPALAGYVDPNDELWLYGSGGRLWRGPKYGGVFVAEPPNPWVVLCSPDDPEYGRRAALTGPSTGPTDWIYAAEDSGLLARFDTRTKRWEELLKAEVDPVLEQCPYGTAATLLSRTGPLFAFFQDRPTLAVYDGTITEEPLPSFASILVELPELGILVGASGEEIHQRVGPGSWKRVTHRTGSLSGVQDIVHMDGLLLFGGEAGGRFSAFDLERETLCEANAIEGIGATETLLRSGEGFLAIPFHDPRASRRIPLVRPVERDVCLPHLP